MGVIIHEAAQRRKVAWAVTSGTSKFSVAFAGRKYCNRQAGIRLKGAPDQWDALGRRCEAAKVGLGPLVGAQLKEKEQLARNWLRFAIASAYAIEHRIAIVGM